MRLSLGLILSVLFHAGLATYVLFWAGGQAVRVNMDRPVYTVDLLSLAPPPPAEVPVVESATEQKAEPVAPVVEAKAEPAVEVKAEPVVEAKPEPKPEPKTEKISPKKLKKRRLSKRNRSQNPSPNRNQSRKRPPSSC